MTIKHSSSGFSFIEVMTAVVIVGILSAIAVPSFKSLMAGIRLQNATEMVKRQLVAAKSRAVANPAIHCGVSFKTTGTRHSTLVFFDDGGTKNNNSYDPGSDGIYQPADSLPLGVTFVLPATNPILNYVVIFRGDGSAFTGGQIEIKNAYKTKTINILASTGRIKTF